MTTRPGLPAALLTISWEYSLKPLLLCLALLLTGCNHYSPAGSVCEPSPLSGEDCKKSQPVGNYLMDKYREWQRYQ